MPSINADYTEWDAQLAIAQLFNYRTPNKAIPSCTTFGWEMDVAVITPANYLYEIEIKRTLSDWKADEAKAKWKMSRHQVVRFYYAIPPHLLEKKPSFVSDDTGIIFLQKKDNENQAFRVYASIHKQAKRIGNTKISSERLQYMMNVFYHRYWNLRHDMELQKIRKVSFLEFCKANADRDDPIGDYCGDTIRYLGAYPIKPVTKDEYYRLVIGRDESVIEAFKSAYREYEHA